MADLLIKGVSSWDTITIVHGKAFDAMSGEPWEVVVLPAHGRLIDADRLYNKWIWGNTDRTADTKCIELIDLSLAPTVLEASEEEFSDIQIVEEE